MYLPQQPRRYSTNVIQFSEFLDQKVQERFSNLEVEAEEQADLADPAIEAEETRPFDKALTAIEANAWLEFCIWLVTISIEGYSALRFVLEEYQLMKRAKSHSSNMLKKSAGCPSSLSPDRLFARCSPPESKLQSENPLIPCRL